MAASKEFNTGASQSVSTDELFIKSVTLTADSANDASLVLYCSTSQVKLKLAAAKGTSFQWKSNAGGHAFAAATFPGPVVIDVVGTGAFARIDL